MIPTDVTSSGYMDVRLCWSSGAPVRRNGSYLGAQLPKDTFLQQLKPDQGPSLSRTLDPAAGDVANLTVQSPIAPPSSFATSWTWSDRVPPVDPIRVSVVDVSGTQRDSYLAFLAGISLGIAGGALIAILHELIAPSAGVATPATRSEPRPIDVGGSGEGPRTPSHLGRADRPRDPYKGLGRVRSARSVWGWRLADECITGLDDVSRKCRQNVPPSRQRNGTVRPYTVKLPPPPSMASPYGRRRSNHGGIVESVAGTSYYDLLGLPPTATPAEIKAAYRRLIPKVHPDGGGTDALFHQVHEAYETLADPAKRATYDGCMKNAPQGADAGRMAAWGVADERRHPPPRASSSNAWRPHPRREVATAAKRRTGTQPGGLWLAQDRTAILVVIAVFILVLGAVLGRLAGVLIAVGLVAMIVALMAVLGSRRVRQREAYRRAGMPAVDTMTGTQFKCLLELLFTEKGYRVARVGGRGESGADLLLGSPGSRSRIIVQAKGRMDLVRHGAVQQVLTAKAYYGANRAVVVAPSNFSDRAIALARSNNVTLWNRATVAQELTLLSNMPMLSPAKRFGSQLRAGVPLLAGGLWAAFVALTASSSGKERRRRSTPRHRRSRRRHH